MLLTRRALCVVTVLHCCAGFVPGPARLLRHSVCWSATESVDEAPVFGGLQHAGVLCSNTEASLAFYTEVLGFQDETELRPNLPFKGAFVRAGGQQIHLMELENPDPVDGRPEHGGRDRHLAFTIRSLAPLEAALKRHGRTYTRSKSGRAAIFTRDPDGNAFEFLEADV
ncbi:lactoylglutathione lyase family protein [Tribonema minus]|uniref:Lactoylglutathione lyase family protein n=1 Tax=Tribonema minus TaxID=303371 RepID=A0A835Z9T1_9STRA|nr:lactoylglutathione lyase family protein [Tribonema minus]